MDLIRLVESAQGGDQTALGEVCRRFVGLVKKHALQRHLRTLGGDAESEGWLAVIQAVRTYDQQSGVHFAGYVESRVKYALWNLFKRERRRWQNEWLLDGGNEEEAGGITLESLVDDCDVAGEVELQWLSGELRQAVAKLSTRQRQVVAGTLLGEQSLTEMAGQMGITVQAVYNLRQRGLARLKVACAGMYQSERG